MHNERLVSVVVPSLLTTPCVPGPSLTKQDRFAYTGSAEGQVISTGH